MKIDLTFGSICSGIEAASAAWHPLGWRARWFAEIDPFCSAVLKHHYPSVPNYGDFTCITATAPGVDVLVGGTPCQSFSIAGLRGGLDDDRGNLALEFCRLVDRLRPRWFVWENVPGVLSSNGGRDFGSILGAMGELGYGTAYRILDAQHFRVPQRRRRVFVVGHLGDWRRAAAVLFERFSLSGNTPPRREAGEGFTHSLAPSLTGSGRGVERGGDSRGQDPVVAMALNAHGGSGRMDGESETFVTHSLRADGFDASEDGTGRGTPLTVVSVGLGSDVLFAEDVAQPVTGRNGDPGCIAFDTTQITSRANYSNPQPGDPCHPLASGAHPPAVAFSCKDHGADAGDIAPTLRSMGHDGSHANAGGQVAVALAIRGRNGVPQIEMGDEVANAILTPNGGRGGIGVGAMMQGMAVRRLTPKECCRLQGFKDDYLDIIYRGKPAADGPKYKALGNSMAVPCMRWIGERIKIVEDLG